MPETLAVSNFGTWLYELLKITTSLNQAKKSVTVGIVTDNLQVFNLFLAEQ